MNGAAMKIDVVSDYMRDVDRTLLRENLKLTFEQRLKSTYVHCRWSKSCGVPAKN
jgi:hypothetical protein